MVALKIQSFGGMIPAEDDRLLPDTSATLAQNTWLYAGSLRGMPSRSQLYTCTSASTRTAFRIPLGALDKSGLTNSYWMEFPDQDVSVVRTPTVGDQYARYYWCGPTTAPTYNARNRITSGNTGTYAPFKLGVPAPTAAPAVAPKTVPADTTAPVIDSATAENYTITLQFRENRRLNAVAVPRVSAFVITSGTTSYTVASVAVDATNKQVFLLVTTKVEPGVTLSVTYTPPTDTLAIQDEANNKSAGFTISAKSLTLDTVLPTYSKSAVSGNKLAILINDNVGLLVTAIPATTAFGVTTSGSSNPVTDVSITTTSTGENLVILTLTNSVGAGATTTLSYTNPNNATSIQDAAGNKLASITNVSVVNESASTNQPVYSSGTINGNTVTLNFTASYNLQGGTINTSTILIKLDGNTVGITSASVIGKSLILTIEGTLWYNSTAVASYTLPATNQLRDTNNNLVAAFSNKTLTNSTPAAPPTPDEGSGGGSNGGGG